MFGDLWCDARPDAFARLIVGDRTCITCRQIERSHDAGAAAAVPVVCRTGAGRRRANGSRSDVVMSGVVDSRREGGHGDIDANDPGCVKTCTSQECAELFSLLSSP